MVEQSRRISFRGEPIDAHVLVRLLENEGVTVVWEAPELSEGVFAAYPEPVVFTLVASGDQTSVNDALTEFRKRGLPGDLQIDDVQ